MGQGAKVAMTIVAMPVTVLGIALAGIAMALIIFDKRGKLYLAAGAGTALLLGALFFNIGVTELATLVGYPDDLRMLGGFSIVMAAFIPAIAATGLLGWSAFRWPAAEVEDDGAHPAAPAPEGGNGSPSEDVPLDDHDDDQEVEQ